MAGDHAVIMSGILSVLWRLAEVSGMPVEEHIKMLGEMWAASKKAGGKLS